MRAYLPLFTMLALLLPSGAMAQRVGQTPSATASAFMGAEPAASARPDPLANQGGESEDRIAAVVGEAPITTGDVKARLALALLSSNLPADNPEFKARLLPQVLRSLVDEQLQLQEGKRLDILVSNDEIDRAIRRIGEDNHIPGGDMQAFLTSHGVPFSTMRAQAKAVLTWSKVVQRELRPRVEVGDDEVDAAAERLMANAGKDETLVSEIFLAVDQPKDEDQVKAFADNLVQQIKEGATFGALARQFSQGTGAGTGGDIGWIQAGQLGPEIDRALQGAQKGDILGPIRGSSGFHILGIRDKRIVAMDDIKDMTVSLQQAFHPFAEGQSKDDLLSQAAELRQESASCEGLKDRLEKIDRNWRWQDLGEVKLADAPDWLQRSVKNLQPGQASEAMATDKGALILYVCARKLPQNIDRAALLSSIGTERMEMLARRLMRDLRRAAYIDVRLFPS